METDIEIVARHVTAGLTEKLSEREAQAFSAVFMAIGILPDIMKRLEQLEAEVASLKSGVVPLTRSQDEG